MRRHDAHWSCHCDMANDAADQYATIPLGARVLNRPWRCGVCGQRWRITCERDRYSGAVRVVEVCRVSIWAMNWGARKTGETLTAPGNGTPPSRRDVSDWT